MDRARLPRLVEIMDAAVDRGVFGAAGGNLLAVDHAPAGVGVRVAHSVGGAVAALVVAAVDAALGLFLADDRRGDVDRHAAVAEARGRLDARDLGAGKD